MIINPQVHWQKGVNSMIVNAFVFLYLKLTRNSWNKELKWNYIYVLFAGREVRIGKKKNCSRYSILRAQQPANSVFKSFSYPWYFQVNSASVLNLCVWVGVCVRVCWCSALPRKLNFTAFLHVVIVTCNYYHKSKFPHYKERCVSW